MTVQWNRKVLIYFDDDHTPEETVAEVSRLISEGFTSGIDPNWEITEDEDTEETKNAGPMKAADELAELSIEHCPECNCAVGDDWKYKDFSCKTIIVCPQCGEEIHTADF